MITIVNETTFNFHSTNLNCGTIPIPATSPGNLLVVVALSFHIAVQWQPADLRGCAESYVATDVDGLLTEVPFYSLPQQNLAFQTPWDWANVAFAGGIRTCADILYVITKGGATSLLFHSSAQTHLWIYELHSDTGTFTLGNFNDTGNKNGAVIGPSLSGSSQAFFICCAAVLNNAYSSVSSPWVLDSTLIDGNAPAYIIGGGNQAGAIFNDPLDEFTCVGAVFNSGPAPPPPPPPPVPTSLCAPVDGIGNPVNGVFIQDLSLFIIPATSLYKQLVPFAAISANESHVQGRAEIILDFNNTEGIYSRDMGTIFTWPVFSETILDVWQPSIIPMDGEIYDRLSYHCLMTSLGTVGWQHAREMNIAYASTTLLMILLTFDQWPSISLVLPPSPSETKQKLTLPPNKFKLAEVFISSTQPFKLWTNDLEMKIKQWGSAETYRVARPVSG